MAIIKEDGITFDNSNEIKKLYNKMLADYPSSFKKD